jgi:hypothetical protein
MRSARKRRIAAALLLLALGMPLALSACGSRQGTERALRDGMVERDRELARTPDQLDLGRPAWQRDWTPARDP